MFRKDIAVNYDQWYQNAPGIFIDRIETEAAFQLYSPQPGAIILDAGCGTGNFSIKLAQAECVVTGIDISADMLALARNKADQLGFAIDFQEMDMNSITYPDHYFEVVFSMAAWEFISDPGQTFAELWRVLKPGGTLLIGTINRNSPWGRLYMEQAKSPDSIFKHAHFKTLDDMKDLNRENLSGWSECLFIPPEASVDSFILEAEEQLRLTASSGFMVVSWQKPL